jgi:NADH-quinone oxidoreductase subunit N
VAAGERADTQERSPVAFVALAEEDDVQGADQPVSNADTTDNEQRTTDNGQRTTDNQQSVAATSDVPVASSASLEPVRDFLAKLVAFLAIITCTFGNLAAYGQTNIKRLMAYSTIAHAGYLMMAVPALLAAAGVDPAAGQKAVSALCIYLGVYLFMNLGAFAIIAFLRNAMGSEEIRDYAGLIYRCPFTVIALSIILLSLIGLPPLAGFIGKFAVFAALVDSYRATAAAGTPQFYLIVVLFAGGINTAVSLFYYLRIVKTMTMDPEPRERRPVAFSDVSLQGAYVWLFGALPTIVLFFAWNQLSEMADAAARHLLY